MRSSKRERTRDKGGVGVGGSTGNVLRWWLEVTKLVMMEAEPGGDKAGWRRPW